MKIEWNKDLEEFDLVFSNEYEDLKSAISLSLFTFLRTKDEDIQRYTGEPSYGYWNDQDRGTRLYLLTGSKFDSSTLPSVIKAEIENNLQKFIELGVIQSIDVQVEQNFVDQNRLDIEITYIRDNNEKIALKYDDIWLA